MPSLAAHVRTRRREWAAPGSRHDRLVRLARNGLPMAIGVLTAFLAMTPLTSGRDISFVLAKDRVEVAHERLRVSRAEYRGQDSKGQPFSITAGSAVQATSRDPVVKLSQLAAQLVLPDGPARVLGTTGRYDMTNERVLLDGPVAFTAADGYRIDTRDVALDLNTKTMASSAPVAGRMPIGTFTAGRMHVDLGTRTVVLDGRPHLHITQARGRRR